jgi:hypothetical protein
VRYYLRRRSGGAQLRVISVAASFAEVFYDVCCMAIAIFPCQSKVRCSLQDGVPPICSVAGRGGHSGTALALRRTNNHYGFSETQCRLAAPPPSGAQRGPAIQYAQQLSWASR